MLADSAYALWQNGEKTAAVTRLAEAMELAPSLPDPGTNLASLRAQKCFGHLLHQLAWRRLDRTAEDARVILPGMCSDPREVRTLRDLPPPVLPFNWVLLLWLEFEHLPSSPNFAKRSAELRSSRFLMVRHSFLELEARVLLREHDLDALLQCAMDTAAVSAALRSLDAEHAFQVQTPESGLPPQQFSLESIFPIPLLLLCGLTSLALHGQDAKHTVATWKSAAKSAPTELELVKWLDRISKILDESEHDGLLGALQDEDRWLRWAHVLRLIQGTRTPPELLFPATLYFALFRWTARELAWFGDTIVLIDDFCSKRWIAASENRFAFRNPTLFLPDLRALASNPRGTVGHLAEMTLVIAPALQFNVPNGMLDELKAAVAADYSILETNRYPSTPLR